MEANCPQSEILEQAVNSLTGVGGKTADRLAKLGIKRIRDLLFHLPYRYEDRTHIQAIASLSPGMTALICGEIVFTDVLQRSRRSLICQIQDGSGILNLRFFHFNAKQHEQLQPGTRLRCFAEIRTGFSGLEMIHPEYKILSADAPCPTEKCLTPIYPLTEGLPQSLLRKLIRQVLERCSNDPQLLAEYLPDKLLQQFNFPCLATAILTLHAPDENIAIADFQSGKLPALQRLAFEEFLAHHLSQLQSKAASKQFSAPHLSAPKALIQRFFEVLGFKLTGAQHRVIREIANDCASCLPMLRLIQGDVGSGKTVVSAYAALLAIHSGYQVAIMAPTELLAEQHFKNFSRWFQTFAIKLLFLSSQTKGLQRKEILQAIENQTANIIIGTHALFQDAVNFKRLGLIIIDEQHRFGVNQRLALREKGAAGASRPHQLIMTATPIPRTLAMLNYSELEISVIDELPPGRTPVITSVIPAQRRQEVIDRISHWVQQGKQAYWVCTLIEESEALQNETAENTLKKLTQALPGLRIALVHGRLPAAEKEQRMLAFNQHKIDLLVATTVIEVGVDVPNAGLIIIENPERLGLAQLHQLRGRVGRGPGNSYCLLMYQQPLSDQARQRLSILRASNDGFLIAEKDLELRGPGEMLGTRQTGQVQFKIADIRRDADLLDIVRQAASILQSEYPETVALLINRWLRDSSQYAEV